MMALKETTESKSDPHNSKNTRNCVRTTITRVVCIPQQRLQFPCAAKETEEYVGVARAYSQ